MRTTYFDLAVVGLHLSGQPLNHQLTSLGAKLKCSTHTAALYHMYLIQDERGQKPGLVRLPHGQTGNAYEVEVWSVPFVNVGLFIANIPPPLGLGTLFLEDGTTVKGFICEPCVVHEGTDISGFKGWKEAVQALDPKDN